MLPLRVRVDLGGDGNEGVLCIPQSPNITRTSPSDYLVSYPRHSFFFFFLGGAYRSAEVQSVYSIAPADWARGYIYIYIYIYRERERDRQTDWQREREREWLEARTRRIKGNKRKNKKKGVSAEKKDNW